MKNNFYVFLAVVVAGLFAVSTADTQGQPAAAQQRGRRGAAAAAPAAAAARAPAPQGRRGRGGPSGINTAGLPKVAGPLGMIMGPTDEVRDVRGPGFPLAPGTDTYYSVDMVNPIMDPMEWPVDEFISNPDREFDWRDLKSWHHVPVPKELTVLGKRRIKAGESVAFEAVVEDLTGTASRMGLSYFGPHGRRSTYSGSLSAVSPGSPILRGALTTNEWTEPGIYYLTYATPSNGIRGTKVFHSDHVAALRGVEIEVLPNTNVDVIPPTIHWVKVNTLNAPEGEILTQPVGKGIPIFAKVTDNKSGVSSVRVRFNTPEGKFIEAALNKVVGQEDVYGAMLTIPEWWGAGEYELLSMWVSDRARKSAHHFRTTFSVLENAVINLTQEDAKHDTTPPTLFSVWVDQTTARLGEPVTVNAIITDDMSGVGTFAVNFTPVPSYINRSRVHLKPVPRPDVIQKAGLDVSQNLWRGTITTNEWMEPGVWKIDRIVARDNADNYLDLLPEYVPEIQTVEVTFTGGIQLREQMKGNRADQAAAGSGSGMAAVGAGRAAATAPPATAGKIRRVDMIPPHPPRGACLNCHEP